MPTTPKVIRFLLVEDDASAAMIAQIALQEGWSMRAVTADVTICHDGLDALRYLQQANPLPHVIVTDIKMPKMDGNHLIGLLKASPFFQKIPIVVLSTSDDPTDIAQAFKGGCAGYILKSTDYEKFSADIELLQRYWELSLLPD